MKEQENQITEGKVLKPLVLFSLPLLGANLLQNLYNMVDSVVAGQYLGDQALAAIGSTAALIYLIIGFFQGISTGAGVKIATAYGAKDWDLMKKTMANALLFSMSAGLLTSLVLYLLIRQILLVMMIPADIFNDTLIYMKSYVLCIPAISIYNTGAAILMALSDSKRPMILLGICSVINLALDLLFVVQLGWGVVGIAWATVIAQFISATLILYMLMRRNRHLTLHFHDFKFDWPLIKGIFRIGLPVAIQASMIGLANVLFQAQVNIFGSMAVAGNAAGNRIVCLLYMPCSAFGTAAITFVGQNAGAKKYHRIYEICRICVLLSLTVTTVLSLLLYLFHQPLIGIFTTEEPVSAIALLHIVYIGLTTFLWTFPHIYGSVITGLGMSFSAMLITLINMGGVRLVWIFIMLRFWNDIRVVYLSYPVSWITAGLCMFIYYRHVCHHRIQRETTAPSSPSQYICDRIEASCSSAHRTLD